MPIVNASHKATWNKTSQHVARQVHLGNTYTPEVFAAYMVRTFLHHDLAASLKEPNERWLEPAVGAGAFYFAILDWVVEQGEDPWRFALRFDALDVDAQAIEVFRTKVRQWFDAHGCAERDVSLLPIYHGSLSRLRRQTRGIGALLRTRRICRPRAGQRNLPSVNVSFENGKPHALAFRILVAICTCIFSNGRIRI